MPISERRKRTPAPVSSVGLQAAPSRSLRPLGCPPLGVRGGSAQPGQRARAPRQPPRNSPSSYPRGPRSRPAPLASAGSGRGAHKVGKSLPLTQAGPHRLSPAKLVRSFSAVSPDHPDSPTPLAESPTIPSAAGTRQLHFRAPRPPPPPRPTRAASLRQGVARGVVTLRADPDQARGASRGPRSRPPSRLEAQFASRFTSF